MGERDGIYRRDVLACGVACLALAPVRLWAGDVGMTFQILRLETRLAVVRRDAGLSPLTHSDTLQHLAWRQVQHIASFGQVTHSDNDSWNPADRAAKANYQGKLLGENLADTHEGPEETLTRWLEHGPTQGVLLEARAREVGASIFVGAGGKMLYSLIVGHPHQPQRLDINS